jgi:hypothetical protein
MFNATLPHCADITITKHLYRVTVAYVDEPDRPILDKTLPAGSVAHASLMAGIILHERNAESFSPEMDPWGETAQLVAHNIGDHTIVSVELVG